APQGANVVEERDGRVAGDLVHLRRRGRGAAVPVHPEREPGGSGAEREDERRGDREPGPAPGRWTQALRPRKSELGRPKADPAVPAGGDVQVGVARSPELGRGRPRRPLRTERRQLGANPLVGPAAAAGIARRRELVARRPTRADADEVACFDELRAVVGGLGAADAGELLVAG